MSYLRCFAACDVQVFVANIVLAFRRYTPPETWRYISSDRPGTAVWAMLTCAKLIKSAPVRSPSSAETHAGWPSLLTFPPHPYKPSFAGTATSNSIRIDFLSLMLTA